jgi:mRNA-degrading endonuclease toxin of MazEF toxin-antitoxin module
MPNPSYRFGDVVYAALGYTDDETVADDRPAVVISSNRFNESRKDVVVMEITGRLHQARRFGAFMVVDWEASGLRIPSVVKPLIFSVGHSQIKERWGHLDPETEKTLKLTLPKIFGFRVSATSPRQPSAPPRSAPQE